MAAGARGRLTNAAFELECIRSDENRDSRRSAIDHGDAEQPATLRKIKAMTQRKQAHARAMGSDGCCPGGLDGNDAEPGQGGRHGLSVKDWGHPAESCSS